MTDYALDTDTVSFILRKQKNVVDKLNETVSAGDTIHIPPLVYFEMTRYLILKNAAAQQKVFDLLYSATGILPLEQAELDAASKLYAALTVKGITVESSDILIAAHCIHHGFTLVTNNTGHFSKIPGLSMINWNT
jgi:predicted nucleic acid-binding protein